MNASPVRYGCPVCLDQCSCWGAFLLSAVDAEQRLISVSTSLTSASISATSCGVMCGNRCDILEGTASIGNDSTAESAAGGLVFTKSEDIEMLSKDLFISMKEIRVKYHFAGIDSDPPRSALSLARGRRKHRCTKVPNCAAPRQAIVKKG